MGAAERTTHQSRACHAHSQRRSRACWACAGRDTPRQPAPGHDLKTSGRDTKLTQPLPRPGRNAKSRSRPSWRLPYVATSISCRDFVSAHSWISRSRHQKSRSQPPPLPPCCDLKNDVTNSNHLSPISATSRRNFSMSRPPLLPPMSRPQAAPQSFQPCRNLKIPGCNTLKTNPGRDLKSMSRPQFVHPKSQRGFSCHDLGLLTPNLSQVATPKRMSRHQLF